MPQRVDIPIEDLLRSGGTPEQAIEELTPAARRLTKGDLVALWLDNDDDVKNAGVGKGRLRTPRLSTEDINSILAAFKAGEGRRPEVRGYYDDRYAVYAISPLTPQAWFDNWSCCCCTPCCCCAAAQSQVQSLA